MRKLIIRSAVLVALGLAACLYLLITGNSPPEPLTKAQHPVSVSLDMVGDPRPGNPVTLTLTAEAQVPVPHAQLQLDLPENLPLTRGRQSWTGPLKKNGKASLQVEVIVPDDSFYQVSGTIIARFPEATSVATDQLTINPSARPARAAPAITQNARGERIIEFPAETKVY